MTATILVGDVRVQLATLTPASVSLCITSPPFFNLRAYSTHPQVWGGDREHAHTFEDLGARQKGGVGQNKGLTNAAAYREQRDDAAQTIQQGACCACGAWRGELGSEPDVASFCAHLVEVFDAVRRVLHPTAPLLVELGDSYSGSGKGPSNSLQGPGGQIGPSAVKKLGNRNTGQFAGGQAPTVWTPLEMPALNLLMVPFRFALAMQDAGWLLRSVMPFVRRNAMPESVSGSAWVRHRIKGDDGLKDCPGCPKCSENDGLVLRMSAGRPSSAVSYVFLFAQQGSYFWDSESIRQAHTEGTLERFGKNHAQSTRRKMAAPGSGNRNNTSFVEAMPSGILPNGRSYRNSDIFFQSWQGLLEDEASGDPLALIVNPQPLSDKRISRGHVGGGTEHYAAFPEKLVEPLIRAGSSEAGVCEACRAPRVRVVERGAADPTQIESRWKRARTADPRDARSGGASAPRLPSAEPTTTGWRPSCACDAPTVPALVLDPFSGSGTSLLVAERLGRDSVGIELSEAYSKLAKRRLYGPLFAEAAG